MVHTKLRKTLGNLVVAAAMTLSGIGALTGCESETTTPSTQGCMKDSDCKGDRICNAQLGFCEGGSGSSSGSSGSEYSNPCGNSPLYGKHLWPEMCNSTKGIYFNEKCDFVSNKGGKTRTEGTYNGLKINTFFEGDFVLKPSSNGKIYDLFKLNEEGSYNYADTFVIMNKPYFDISTCKKELMK